MIKVLGRKNSVNVQKVLWTLEELNEPYQRVNYGGYFGGNNTPEYKEKNPNGLVPTIEDNGFVLWESNSIIKYLAKKNESHELYPDNLKSLALAWQWMDWANTTLWPQWSLVFKSIIKVEEKNRNWDEINSAAQLLGEIYSRLDRWLISNQYVSGEHFSMGDIPIGATCYRYFELPIEKPTLPNLERWYRCLSERIPYKKTVMTPFGDNPEEWTRLEQANAD